VIKVNQILKWEIDLFLSEIKDTKACKYLILCCEVFLNFLLFKYMKIKIDICKKANHLSL
jgi:hypothetical protein